MPHRWPRNCRPWKPGVGPEAAVTVDDALRKARDGGVHRLDAQLLLGAVLQRDRAWLISHGEHVLTHQESTELQGLMRQRSEGMPLAYLLGHREFHGLRLRVTPDVLDPRPDTETLVEWALSLMMPLPSRLSSPLSAPLPAPRWEPPVGRPSADVASAPGAFHGARVLDLGTGSGAIALALKHACPEADMYATDASAAALAVARGNATALGLAVTFHEGSWWHAVGGLRFDVVVSNPPYIREDDPHLAALVHEPRAALVAGEQGLADIRAIIDGAQNHLSPGAWLLFEHGFDQGQAVAALLRGAGFIEIDHRLDLAGHTRCTGGRLPR